ncbi:substrate-binding domain-containing protein, partial [Paraclostridium bifermentans]|uniref:substrate-binding domain-containing protein n=1 Tax=Paraclostridium bifermentans TaxID=1490 RepID=UPI00242C9270
LILDATIGNNDFLISLKSKINNIILIDRVLDEECFSSVISDNYEITTEAINYMVDMGYKYIFFVSFEIENIPNIEIRKKAFINSMNKICNEGVLYSLMITNDLNEKYIKNKILEIKRLHNKEKIGFFIANGITLLKLLKIIRDIKLEIPKDIGVCSYEDWEWGELVGRGITSIKQQSYEMGKMAAKCVIDRIEGKENCQFKTIELPCKIIKRGSL